MKYLGIDYGQAGVGLALAEGRGPAVPVKILDKNGVGSIIDRIKEFIDKEKIEVVVVGWPLSLSGRVVESTKNVDTFVKALRAAIDKEIVLEDERLSSKAVTSLTGQTKGIDAQA